MKGRGKGDWQRLSASPRPARESAHTHHELHDHVEDGLFPANAEEPDESRVVDLRQHGGLVHQLLGVRAADH